MKNKIKLTESQLVNLITNTVSKIIKEDNVLFPNGGNIGGEHQKKIKDGDVKNVMDRTKPEYYREKSAYYARNNKILDRVEDYFGSRDLGNTIFKFVEDYKMINRNLKEIYPEYPKEQARAINVLISRYPEICSKLCITDLNTFLGKYDEVLNEYKLFSDAYNNRREYDGEYL